MLAGMINHDVVNCSLFTIMMYYLIYTGKKKEKGKGQIKKGSQ